MHLMIKVHTNISRKKTKWPSSEIFVPQFSHENEKTNKNEKNQPPRIHRLKVKEKEEHFNNIEQKLKEYFVSNLNAFVDYASNDKACLDHLEIEIPLKVLDFLHITLGSDVPYLYIVCNDEIHESFNLHMTGYNEDGSYDSFCTKEFYLNENETCELIGHSIFETQWQKLYKLNGNHTLKFKFHFQQFGQNYHKVIFGGQTFNFNLFQFDLRTPRKLYSCKFATQFNYFQVYKKKGKSTHSACTPQERVQILENAGIKFKFKFSSSIYNMENILNTFNRPNYVQNNNNKFDQNFQNYLNNCHKRNIQNNFYHTGEKYQNFDLEQDNFLQDNYSFDENSFFQENIYVEQKEIFLKESDDSFDENSFFQDNIYDEESSIIQVPEDTNPAIFEQQSSPNVFSLEDKLKAQKIRQKNLDTGKYYQ